jgi:hypothetical protein
MSWEKARLLRRQMPVEANTLIAAAIDDGDVKMPVDSIKEAIDLVVASSAKR